MKILVVGGGIGGLATAYFLKAQGFTPVVIERCPEWRVFGILGLYPCGVHMLKRIGILDQLAKESELLTQAQMVDNNGKVLHTMNLSAFKKKHGIMLEVLRKKLHAYLVKAVHDVEIRMGTTVKTLLERKDKVSVTFSNGKKEDFDLVVGADGFNSQMRGYVQPEAKHVFSGFTFWAVIMNDKKTRPKHVQYCFGNGKLCALFPIKSKTKYGVLFMLPAREHAYDRSMDVQAFLRKHFADMKGAVPEVLKNLPKEPADMYHHDDDEMHLRKWYKGRVVLIGDAIHAVSPLTGLGASMAMEDGYVLAEELAMRDDYEEAFARYHNRRKDRVHFVHVKTKEIHLCIGLKGLLAKLRNGILKLGYAKHLYKQIDHFLEEEI